MVYVDLVLNLALLVALSIVSGFINRHPLRHRHLGSLLQGVVFGGAAVLGMLRPLSLGHGVIFDGRSVMLSLCGLYFGPLATLVAAALAGACRISLGGDGLRMGLLVILSSSLIGLLARRRLSPETEPPPSWTLYGFGLVVHLCVVGLMTTLPAGAVVATMTKVGLPVLLLYPLATVLAGHILSDQVQATRRLGELRDANAYLEKLIDQANSPIVVWDAQFRIVRFNRALELLTGRNAAQVLGQPIDSVLHPNNRERVMAHLQQPQDGTRWNSIEMDMHHVDGSVRTAIWNSGTIYGPDGTALATIAQGQDITERKQAEEALRQSEAQLHAITDSAQDAILMMDPQGLVTFWNPAAERIFGYAAEEVIGQNLHQLLAFPEHREAHLRALPAFQKAGTGEAVGKTLDFPAHRKDGKRILIQLSLSAIQMNDGWHSVGLLHDVTEQKRGEERLRESEERFRLLVKNSSDIIAVIDAEGIQRYISPAAEKITGFSAEELVGRSFRDLIHPDDVEAVQQAWNQIVQQPGGVRVVTYRQAHKATGWVFLEAFAQNFLADPAVRGVVASVRDISGRRRAEQEKAELEAQLQQAQKMESVGRLAGGVAHDFNNILQAILGYTDMTLEAVPADSPIRRDLEEIYRMGQRAADLTRQLLAFARRQTITPEELDLNDSVSGMLNMLERLIGENITLVWLPGQDIWHVKLDPVQVDQLLTNLCLNARDAIAGIGELTIETANCTFDQAYCAQHPGFLPGDYVRLTVSDNGCGMDPETRTHLFEPFFTTKGQHKGTGLGLAMVYGAVKQNNGFIDVESAVGQGTSFRIYLPRHTGESEPEPLDLPDHPVLPGQETILLTEDDPAILRVAQIMLERQGYTVLAASTPGGAVALALQHPGQVDLLITDVIMPEMNGRELANRLQATQPRLKCLFVSGYTADVIARHGVLDEGLHFLAKPFTAQDLALKVRQALNAER